MRFFSSLVSHLKKSKKGASLVETLIVTAVLGTLAIGTLTSLATTLTAKNTQVVNKLDNGITNSLH